MEVYILMMKKILLSPWTALLTLALVLGIRVADPAFVESVRLRYFDTLITAKAPTQNNIVTVNIDEAALDQYGQWPFSRATYANIIEDLYRRGAGLVVWNVLMPEQDRQGGDDRLAGVMSKYPVILSNVPAQATKNTPKNPGATIINSDFQDRIINYPGIIANIPKLENAAVGVGISNTLPEIDGVNRRIPLVVSSGGQLYPSVSMEVLRVIAGDPSFQIKLNENGVEKMRIPTFGPISTDSLGRIWIDWSQQNQSVSLARMPTDFKGAVVIVGTSAAGIANPVPTARGAVFPQDVQAAVIGTAFNKVNIERPDYADSLEILAIALAGIVLLFLTRWTYVGLAGGIAIVVVSIVGSRFAYSHYLYLFDTTVLAGGILLVMLHAYGVKFISEFLQKQQIKKQFGTYLSPALVAKLQKNPELLQLGGDERELSIMFTDVRGFTSISEHYGKDVQGLTKIMNRYMTAMTAKILDNNGTLDKYIGDAQMAFWNAPVDEPRHAHQAVKTALEMMGSLDGFNKEIASEGVPAFGMGLGINTAAVVVGNMGSSQRFDYTCLGDGVNLASRLEGQSKPYGVKIVLGQRTAELIKDEYFVLELDCIAVKGKKEGVNIFTVLGHAKEVNINWALDKKVHNTMINAYRGQKWTVAISLTKQLKGCFGGAMDHYYDMWLERCNDLKDSPLGADWDGVYRTNTK
jgi:adenylate cyclase